MISMRMKNLFFDSPKVIDAIEKDTRKNLATFGGYVRKTARRSIKNAPFTTRKKRGQKRTNLRRKVSRPGTPPYNRRGHLKKGIAFFADLQAISVIIGPERQNRIGDAPHALERGGLSKRKIRGRGGSRLKTVKIRARPYMAPAFEIGKTKLPAIWSGKKP